MIIQSCSTKVELPNDSYVCNRHTWISSNHERSILTIQTTLWCMLVDCSDQPQPSFQTSQSYNHKFRGWCNPTLLSQPITSSRYDVIKHYGTSQLQAQEKCFPRMLFSKHALYKILHYLSQAEKQGRRQKQRSNGQERKLMMGKEGRAQVGSRPQRAESEMGESLESRGKS